MDKNLRLRKSVSLVFVTLCIVALIGSLGLIVDKGRIYYYRWKLTNACQSAAMASVYDLPDKTKAQQNFDKTLVANNFPNNVGGRKITETITDNKVVVTGIHTIDMTFAKLLGYNKWTVSTEVTSICGPIAALKQVAPLGIVYTGNTLQFAPQRYRLETNIHYSSGTNEQSGYNLKMYALDYPGGLSNNILNGYSIYMKINETPKVLNNDSTTYSALKSTFEQIDNSPNTLGTYTIDDSFNIEGTPRLLKVPIVSEFKASPHQVLIRGFALFYVEQVHVIDYDGTQTVSLVGFFLKYLTEGPIYNNTLNFGITGSEMLSVR